MKYCILDEAFLSGGVNGFDIHAPSSSCFLDQAGFMPLI